MRLRCALPLLALASALPAAGLDVARLGLSPVQPAPAPPLVMETLGGERFDLASEHGRWVVVTFWATWCGPCRAELPTLEAFHQAVGPEVLVVGVSIDRRREPIAPFARQLGLSFPIGWDEGGVAARAWRASSVPMTWVVDPAGQVVGVSRGAKDWSRLAPAYAALAGGADGAILAPEQPPPQPVEINPPTAVATVSDEPRVGRPFELEIRISWSGRLEDYVLHPPSLDPPEGIEMGRPSASTDSSSGQSIVTYRQPLTAQHAGEFSLDPIELRYTPRGESEPVASRIAGPTVRVERRVAGLPPKVAAAVAGGSTILLGAGLALAWVRRRRGETTPPVDGSRQAELVGAARRARIDGDVVACLEALAAADGAAGETPDPRLATLLQLARYAGSAPAPSELDQLIRRAERRLGDDPQLTSRPLAPPTRLREERS